MFLAPAYQRGAATGSNGHDSAELDGESGTRHPARWRGDDPQRGSASASLRGYALAGYLQRGHLPG